MKQCPKGHIYDEKRSAECPYCRNDGNSGFQHIGGMGGIAAPDFPRTMPVTGAAEDPAFPATLPVDDHAPGYDGGNPGGMSVTVALDETPTGISPVRGWLVLHYTRRAEFDRQGAEV